MVSGIYILLIFMLSKVIGADPCTSYTTLTGQHKRSSSYTLQSSDVAISDNFLTSGWYRFDSGAGNDMVTSGPSMSQCGTVFPIWMQGTLPSEADGEVTRTACIVGIFGSCDQTLSIKVKSCTGYRVYHLVPPPQTSTGYCIGEGSPCPAGQSSSTGFTPCQVSTPVNTDPTVNVSLENGELFPNAPMFRPIEAVFKCLHPEPGGGPYWYDTHWYINTDEVKVVESVPYQNNQSWLYPKDWVHKYNMNMVVKCSVRVRQSDGGTPGHHNYSQDFQAGMFPASSTYAVKEGEIISIEFNVTVPMGCYDINAQQMCNSRIYVLTPEYQSDIGSCRNYTGQGGVSFEENQCGIQIESSTWWQKKTLNVTGKTDGLINVRDRDTNIRLGAQTLSAVDPSGVWFNFTMPDIKIHLYDVDKNIADKLCYANTDPRMETFDEKYWTAQGVGEFILYRDVRRKIAVHALFSSCTWQGWLGQGPCGCGIAVRVEDSLFVYRTCQEISYRYAKPLIHHDTVYHVCDNRHMVVDIGRPWTKITLPTGAIVEYRVGRDWLYNIHITPSIFDEDNVDGLCGNPNNDHSDDFIPRGSSSPTSDKNTFQSSWRVDTDSSESLFGPNPALNSSDFELKKYCDCATEMSGYLDPLSNHYTANCSIAAEAVLCSRDSTSESFTSTCKRHEIRYKRESNPDSDDVTEKQPLTIDPQLDFNFSPPTPTWKNGWTESSARTHCENAILGNHAVVECKKYITMENKTNGAVEDCILDIRDAGTTEFVSHTVESLSRFCFEQIKKYEVFYTTNGTQTESVIDMIGRMVCPDNCSANGVCSAGVCICSSSFVGVDCSHAKTSPPLNTTLPENGLCKSNKRACAKTNVYGYFESDVVHVKFVHFEITDSGKSSPISTYTVMATYVSPTIIKADFPTISRRKRSSSLLGSGFDISLSYDGTNFGDVMSLVIFNDECYNCSAVTLDCNITMSCTESTTSQTSTDTGPTTTMSSGGQNTHHPVGGGTQHRTTTVSDVYKEKDVPLVLIVAPCVLLVLILVISSMLLYMKLRPNPKPSPLYPEADIVQSGPEPDTLECGKPPVQHGRPLSPPPRYDSVNPRPHNDGEDSKTRPQTPSAITMEFLKMPNMPDERG